MALLRSFIEQFIAQVEDVLERGQVIPVTFWTEFSPIYHVDSWEFGLEQRSTITKLHRTDEAAYLFFRRSPQQVSYSLWLDPPYMMKLYAWDDGFEVSFSTHPRGVSQRKLMKGEDSNTFQFCTFHFVTM